MQLRGAHLDEIEHIPDRIKLGDGITEKLILAFCDSPYLSGENYEEVLHELLECFYLFKNETADCIGDDALLRFLRKQFDGPCGSRCTDRRCLRRRRISPRTIRSSCCRMICAAWSLSRPTCKN